MQDNGHIRIYINSKDSFSINKYKNINNHMFTFDIGSVHVLVCDVHVYICKNEDMQKNPWKPIIIKIKYAFFKVSANGIKNKFIEYSSN